VSSPALPDVLTYLLLIVEPFLLVVTILLLVLNRREMKSRDSLLRHLSATADVVTRQEYFVTVLESLHAARSSVSGSVTGSAPQAEEGEVIQQVADAISMAVRRGVKVRYLLPYAPDRLQMAHLYAKAGADVRFSPGVLVSDARYMVIDGRSVVIGVPERKGRDEPTRKGYVVPSESIATMFSEQFERQWAAADSRSYDEHLGEVVAKARKSNPTISSDLIASNLRVSKDDVEKVLSRLH